MRAVTHALLLAAVGCYSPSPPEGAPCTSSGTCPTSLVCDEGRCVRTPRDASEIDQADVDAPIDVAWDAMIDAPIAPSFPLVTYGPGTHIYTVPDGCTELHVRLWGGGAGGGGDGNDATAGTEGGDTVFGGLRANGGLGGADGNPDSTYLGGAGGTASGGTTTLTGGSGGNGDGDFSPGTSGKGGDCPNGGTGGAAISDQEANGDPGDPPGGGGSGAQRNFSPAAGGGAGGYAENVFEIGDATAFMLTVGAGGPGGAGIQVGGDGAPGRATLQCM